MLTLHKSLYIGCMAGKGEERVVWCRQHGSGNAIVRLCETVGDGRNGEGEPVADPLQYADLEKVKSVAQIRNKKISLEVRQVWDGARGGISELLKCPGTKLTCVNPLRAREVQIGVGLAGIRLLGWFPVPAFQRGGGSGRV